MGIFWLFDTCGWIFGPAIILAGLTALGLCLRATLRPASPRAGRLAVATSLSPVALGLCGALIGLALLWYLGEAGNMKAEHWLALGKVILAGLVVAAPSLVWAMTLRVRRGDA
jgi:hypothetical protein